MPISKSEQFETEQLLEFVNNRFEGDEIFKELLKLDIYLRENIKSRPIFAEDDYKEILRPYYRKYKSEHKVIHIEMFKLNVIKWINEGIIIKENQIILFNYNLINPVNHWCEIMKLEEEGNCGE